ncbi:hypothetical protein, partial [Oceanobacillus damuensis]|uniref:hypothetical protein n=1 Tax=Oceanobacillus damuensis TaxID=937928 RepID=UPI001F417DCB
LIGVRSFSRAAGEPTCAKVLRCLTYASHPGEVSVYFPELDRRLLPIIFLSIPIEYGRNYIYFKNAECDAGKLNVLIFLS